MQTTQEPPSWAKELLEQQKKYSTELQKIKKDLDAAKRSKQEKSLVSMGLALGPVVRL